MIRNIYISIVLVICFSLGYLILGEVVKSQETFLTIYSPDIGQGDGKIIVTPEGHRVLLDTGKDIGPIAKALDSVLPPLSKHIDLLMITHGDADHVGAAVELMDHVHIGALLLPEQSQPKPEMVLLKDQAISRGIPIHYANSSQDISIGSIKIDILPGMTIPESENNFSTVFRMHYGEHSFIFTGDAEKELEHHLAVSQQDLSADIYFGGHHGSSTSSTEEFIQNVHPKYAIFQNGKNNTFGHPTTQTMDLLSTYNVTVYNTSMVGDITTRCTLWDCTITTDYAIQ